MVNSRRCRNFLLAATAMSLALTGCATTGGPTTEVDRAIGKCVGTIAGGTVLGALIAGAFGGDAGDGALIGAGVGAGACAVLVAVASEKDRENIRRQQAMAAQDLELQVMEYTNEKGQKVRLETEVDEADVSKEYTAKVYERAAEIELQKQQITAAVPASPAIAEEQRICRRTSTTVTLVDSGKSTKLGQLVCRTADGDWVPFVEPADESAALYLANKAWG